MSFVEIIDYIIVFVALFFALRAIKGSSAFSIALGLGFIFLLWLILDKLGLKLTAKILQSFIGVGTIAILIVFQKEVRTFLLYLGKKTMDWQEGPLNSIFSIKKGKTPKKEEEIIDICITACKNLSIQKTGALIVFAAPGELNIPELKGVEIDAKVSRSLIETIFNKNVLLHDGAAIIVKGRLKAAGSVLPLSENASMPVRLGTRHRAALGITENTNVTVLIVSEETGKISVAREGRLFENLNENQIKMLLLRRKMNQE